MFKLELETGNAAFNPLPMDEISRILRQVNANVLEGDVDGTIRDVNGNTVGKWTLRPGDR